LTLEFYMELQMETAFKWYIFKTQILSMCEWKGTIFWERILGDICPSSFLGKIRMMLILSSILDLKTRQVDYTQAFPQATLDHPVYMRVPQGWYIDKGKLRQHTNPKHNEQKYYMN